jgi:hypothetical protein
MGVVARPSQVVLLLEDDRHLQFIFKYLRILDFGTHAMRVVKSPSGAGSAEQWVRKRFAVEVEARRSRQAETKLIVIIDADVHTVQQRILQLDQALREGGVPKIGNDDKGHVARLVPKRNIETWILCLNGELVDEDRDYKRTREDWADLIQPAAGTLFAWTRPNAAVPRSCVKSLEAGIRELQNSGL